MNILVIEDSATTGLLYEAIFKSEKVTVVTLFKDGIDKALAESFDVVVLDINLPDVPNVETSLHGAKRLAATGAKVVVVTGLEITPEMIRRFIVEGRCEDIITKDLTLNSPAACQRAVLYAALRKERDGTH